MNNKIINKSIICGIILLFVGTGVVPSINGIVDTTNETLNEKTIGTTYIAGPGIDNWFIVDTVGWWQFGGKCMVNIGEPWQLAVQEKTDRSYRYLRELTDKLMNNVQDLVDQAAKSFNY